MKASLDYVMEVNNRDALVPPKPKEFDITALISIFFEALKGIYLSSKSGSGFRRLSVGGAIP